METANRSQKVRNARACEACRSSKSKCLFSNQRNACQRCEQSGNPCIVRAKARPLRARASQGNPASNNPSRSDDSEFSIDLPTVTAPDRSADCEELFQHHKMLFSDDDARDPAKGQSSDQLRPNMPLIEQRKVDRNEAERLLLAFRSKASFFPFVVIPQDATVPGLSRTSPFLLLAILTVGSTPDLELHHQMDQEFRRVLSSEVIVEGQKSLDFLQGMLVYIAWYPIHSKPKNNQSFMYLSLAISLAMDLGLDEERPNECNFRAINTSGLIEDGLFTKSAKRAYFGCCYLSSALSTVFVKFNTLQQCNLMGAHGEQLLQDELSNQYALNEVTSLVKLHRLIERIVSVYSSKPCATRDSEDGHIMAEMNIQIFLNELQDWRTSTSDKIRNLPFIGLAERFTMISIYSHELGLLRRHYRNHLMPSEDAIPAHQTHLWQCLEACKRFFEFLLSVPESTYSNFTTVQWTSIDHAILVLSRLTFLMAFSLAWDPDTTRANIPFIMYLDALSYRLHLISSTTTPRAPSDRPHNPDAGYVFELILGSLKKSYERRVASIQPKSLAVESGNLLGGGVLARGHCPRHDPALAEYFDTAIEDSAYGGSLIATPASSYGTGGPIYYDLWATMTGRWAKDI